MRFRVVGSEKISGEGVDLEIEAPNEAWALRIAKQKGLLVDSVDPAAPLTSRPAPQPTLALKPAPAATAKTVAPKAVVPKSAPRNVLAPQAPSPKAVDDSGAPLPLLNDDAVDTPPKTPAKPAQRAAVAAEAPLLLTDEMAIDDDAVAIEAPLGLTEPVLDAPPSPRPAAPARTRAPAAARAWRLKVPVNLRKPLIGVGILLLIAVGLWGLWELVLSDYFGSGLSKYLKYAPADTREISFVNLAVARKSDAFKDDQGPVSLPNIGSDGFPFSVDDVEAFFEARGRGIESIHVFRTRKDYALKDFPSGHWQQISIGGTACVHGPLGSLARIGSGTYCMARNDDLLRDALARAKGKVAIDSDLMQAMDAVDGHDVVHASRRSQSMMLTMGEGMPQPVTTAQGTSFGGTNRSRRVFVFGSESDAQKYFDKASTDLQKDKSEEPKASDAEARAALKRMRDSQKISRSGRLVAMSEAMSEKDRKLIKDALTQEVQARQAEMLRQNDLTGIQRRAEERMRQDFAAQAERNRQDAETRRQEWEQQQRDRAEQQRQQNEQRRRDREERQRQAQERLRQSMQRPGGG